jgi:hypothetical protein
MLVLERHELTLVGAGAGDADRRTIERREEGSVRHFRAYLVEERLKAEIDPGGRRCIMVRWQEKFWLEQLDEGPRIIDLRVGDRVHLIGDDGDIDGAELFSERLHARRDRSGAADEHGLET